MSLTTTPNLHLKYPADGTEIDVWGTPVGANFPLIDTAVKANADAILTKAPLTHQHDASTVFSGGTVPAARLPLIANTGLVVGTVNTVKGTVNGTANVDIPFATITAGVGGGGGTVPDNYVTNAKLADMAAATMKGSIAGGDPADLSVAQILAMLGVDALIYTEGTIDVGANRNVALTDSGKLLRTTAGTGTTTLSFVTDATIPIGAVVNVGRYGAGEVALTGATMRSPNGLRLNNLYSGCSVKKIGASEWWVFGDMKT